MISKLKIERIKKDLTQIQLWMKTGIPQWRLSQIERGIIPTPDEKQKIADALDVEAERLFPIA
jgi:transcriptional regulator with XRE-family HTH domain